MSVLIDSYTHYLPLCIIVFFQSPPNLPKPPTPPHFSPLPSLPPPSLPQHILSGDCGGTNTRLQLHSYTYPSPPSATSTIIKSKTYLNEKYKSFNQILQHFLKEEIPVIPKYPSVAVIAAAGPVKDNSVLFTNNGWLISGVSILFSFGGPDGIQEARLINDFVGLGYGVLEVKDSECVTLNSGTPTPGAPIVCVGAGTGLGECYLTSCNGDQMMYECFPSEGGHAEFAPRTEVEIELLRFLKKKFQQKHRVSTERVVSGTGLVNVYEFFAQRYPEKVNAEVALEFTSAGSMKGKVVSMGADKGCEVCIMSMKTFASAYGSEVGSCALKWIPRGGLYVAGGLTPKVRGGDGWGCRSDREIITSHSCITY